MLTFKVLDLLVDDDFMSKEDIDIAPMLGWKKDTGETLYSFTAKVEASRYLLIYCEYDNKQYRETVYDMEQEIEAPTLFDMEQYKDEQPEQ